MKKTPSSADPEYLHGYRDALIAVVAAIRADPLHPSEGIASYLYKQAVDQEARDTMKVEHNALVLAERKLGDALEEIVVLTRAARVIAAQQARKDAGGKRR